jgi:sugar transferase (PEP-CTERM/EpsH1 system associated)
MRILYLCHRIPYPPNKGEKIRAFHQIKAIAERHEVDLFTLADQAADLSHQEALHQYCREVTVVPIEGRSAKLATLPFLLTSKPLSLAYFRSAELDLRIRRATSRRSYDRIMVFCSSMAQYVWHVSHIPVLVDLVDVDSDKWMQYAAFRRFPFSVVYQREGRYLKQYEKELYHRFPAIAVTTEREAQLVKQACNSAFVHVIPNGVDTNYFDPPSALVNSPDPVITFVGDMAYYPNEKAALFFGREVFPLIRKSFPKVQFFVVGRDPSREVRNLERTPGIKVTGTVGDVRPYLTQTTVSVAPLSIATGIQNKILESMAYERPVVATSRAAQGLSKPVAELVETGDGAEELAAKAIGLLSDVSFARRRGAESRQRVLAEYSWKRSSEQLLQILEQPSIDGKFLHRELNSQFATVEGKLPH